MLKQGSNDVEDFSHASLLYSSFYEIRNRELRVLSMKWTRQALPPLLLYQEANANHSNWRIMPCQIETDSGCSINFAKHAADTV